MTEQLAQKAISSVAWTYLSYILTKGVLLITTAVLARLITKSEFGVIGFAITSMSFLDAVRDLGIGLALIQRRDDVEQAAHTAFWMGVSSNVVMWLLACLSAPLVAWFFHEDQILVILPILSFSFVISSLGGIHDALMQREMKFARRFIPAIGESVSKGIISVALALSGAGVWSLILGQLVGRVFFMVLVWRVMPWRPAWLFSRTVAGSLFSYGYKIALDSLLSSFQANIDYVFIGRFLGEAPLGVYTIAFRIPELVIINFCIVIAQVLFPTYSILQTNMEDLQKGLLTTLRYISIVTFPASFGLALIAEPFTLVFFGKDWAEAAPVMGMLALYGVFLAASWNIGDVYKAIGRPDILWKTAIFEFIILAPTLYFMAQRSVYSVSVGHASVAFFVSATRVIIASYLIKVPLIQIAHQFIPAVTGTVAMAAALQGVLALQWAALPTLATGILVGATVYIAILSWFEQDLIQELRGSVLKLRWQKG